MDEILKLYVLEDYSMIEEEIEKIREDVSEEDSNRLDKISNKVIAFPKQSYPVSENGTYNVYTRKGEGFSKKEVDMSSSDHECTCEDFFYNQSRDQSCKHIWLCRLMIKRDLLPGPEESKSEWVSDKIEKTIGDYRTNYDYILEALAQDVRKNDFNNYEVTNLYSIWFDCVMRKRVILDN